MTCTALLIVLMAAQAASSGPAAGTDPGETIAWKECVREAWQGNPDLAAALARLGQSKAERRIAASPLFPEVTASGRAGESKGTDGTRGESHAWGLDARQLLFDGFRTPFEMGRAGEGVTASQWAYAVTSSDVRLSLRKAYVDLLRAQDLVTIAREIADRRKQNTDLVQLRYEAGREHKGSLMLSQADLAQAEYDIAAALRAVELGRRRLTRVMGRPHTAPLGTSGDFVLDPPGPARPDFEGLCDTVPLLKRLAAVKEAARWGVKSAQAEFLPAVYDTLGVNKAGDGWPPRGDEREIGVSVDWPLFQGGERVAGVAKSRQYLLQTEADERSGRLGVVLTLTETWTEFRNALETVEVERKVLAAAEERSKISKAQYAIGIIDFDAWTIIEDALVRAKKSHLNALWAEGTAEAAWVQARGGTLEDELR